MLKPYLMMCGIFTIFIFLILTYGCAYLPGGEKAPNYQDGTWSNCTYTSPNGRVIEAPLQLGGQPMSWSEPNGMKVECKPIK